MEENEQGQEDVLDEESEEVVEKEVSGGPKPTLSDILLTKEEKLARQVYRLTASKCCVEEAWRMYRRVKKNKKQIM